MRYVSELGGNGRHFRRSDFSPFVGEGRAGVCAHGLKTTPSLATATAMGPQALTP